MDAEKIRGDSSSLKDIDDSSANSFHGDAFAPPPVNPLHRADEEHKNQHSPSRVLGVPQYQSGHTGGRNFDYDSKYPTHDPPGEEASENARVWMIYNDEAELFDDDMLRGFRDTIDSLLVFAALFSAVVTTFLVETSALLQPDHAQITTYLLAEQILLLRANGNLTAINSVPPSLLGPGSITHNSSDIAVNVLFFMSLALSLSTALFSILTKQWLTAYAEKIPGTPKDVALTRNLRFSGFKRWRLHEFIAALPLVLHASLWIFAAGLLLYIWERHLTVFCATASILGATGLVYMISMLIPPFFVDCPYHFPFHVYVRFILENLWVRLEWTFAWARYLILRVASKLVMRPDSYFSCPNKPLFSSPPWIMRRSWERRSVRRPANLCDAAIWLYESSTNSTIRHAAAKSLAGILPLGKGLDHQDWLGNPRVGIALTRQDSVITAIWSEMVKFSSSLPTSSQDLFSTLDPSSPTYNPWVRAETALRSWYHCLCEANSTPPSIHPHPHLHRAPAAVIHSTRMEPFRRGILIRYILAHNDVWDPKTLKWKTQPLDWDCSSDPWMSPLAIIARDGLFDLVEPVSRRAQLNNLDKYHRSFVYLAALQGHLDTVKAFAAVGADLTLGRSPLLEACERGDFDMAAFLLEQPGVIEATCTETLAARSLYSYPIRQGNVDIVQLLLERGVQETLDRQIKLLALANTTSNRRQEIVDMLNDAWVT
ncbi:hypothetical protein DL96DRAFT_1608205 [Flagelloscypha sp. PMI_526]|nr:hypothetical protein DL96DRAFT_1608205 [Flagelloscypha sp. PMI_526]